MPRGERAAAPDRTTSSSRRAWRDVLELDFEVLADSERTWVRRWGDPERHLGNTALVGFDGCPGELVLMNLDLEGVAVSTGSACNSGKFAASKVLSTMLAGGPEADRATEVVRMSLGKSIDEAQVDRVLELLPPIVTRVRATHAAAVDGGPH